ncbi:prolyl oligopeptidase family serine peptidase [Luteolibacter flavescens]|uniref:Prolyl oligopeptidase family serine peptidase n=1 Tax=Luteolibacter flavescens TaxID=1859460 RepID=A0ABT3FKW2_9BACT|nr:prolyl oligopeptidase family serine peptidase [Luteolibacter flavescens]MCW1884207.1 prolyl oligopeptidase family serine peptidase [Luteolibacter flavescens]
MKARHTLLACFLLATAAHADHGNLASFNQLTGRWYGVAKTKVLNESVDVRWAPGDAAAFYQLDTPEGGKIRMKLDPATGQAGPAAESDRMPETRPDERRGNRRRDGRGGPRGSWKSPDGRWEVALREGEVILRDTKDGTDRTLAKGDAAGNFTGQPLWAPDSSRFAIWKEKDVKERIVHYIESSPKDQLQPKHFTNSYPKPGDVIDTRAPWVFFTGKDEAPIATDPKLIENPFECRELAWRGDSKRLTFEFIERGFGKHNIIEIDSATRQQRVLVREESDTFVFVYGYSFRRDLGDGNEILWMSERDGWKHLYLLDGRDGSTRRQLTKGEWIVREVVNVDEGNREVLLKISGYHKGQDPYYIHYARVSMETGELIPLTKSDGTHDRFERSPDGNYYTCRWSRVNKAPVTELRRWADGELVATLAEADDAKLRATAWPIPEPFVSKDRDGKYDIHGIVCLPPDFDPAKKYPVIENIYAGPQDSFVPKAWNPWMQPKHEIAVHGFIVVQIDGKGTANRSKEFHHFCYKNLKDAGFPDRIAWLKEAAKKWPQMDLERVGIFGGSAGGQNALGAMLFHGDFYKAAVADCGCHDNRMDKIWWNEQWMDWPVGPEYADNSNVTHAKNLKGALLLTVGEVDTNVDPSSTYQVINALIAADKDFEFLPMTGRNHGAGEERYAQRRRVDFFRSHLGGPR